MLKNNSSCELCPLHKTTNDVCILGSGGRRGMIIGEAPGYHGDSLGGKSGQLFDKLFKEVGLKREDFYVTNALHCSLPENKSPSKKEINACKTWIEKEIAYVKPKYVLLLGNTPLLSLLGLKGIKRLRGKPIEEGGVFYLPTYHPAFAVRDPTQETTLKNDLLTFANLVKTGGMPKEQALNMRVVNSDAMIDAMIADIENSSMISWDLETTGLYPYAADAEITSFGVGTATTQWIFPLQHNDPENKYYDRPIKQKETLQRIVDAAQGAEMVAHNGKFDTNWLFACYSIDWRCDFDTMLAHYVLDENSRHGLKELATRYCAAPNYDIGADAKRGYKSLAELAFYHAHDLFYTYKLARIFKRELNTDQALKTLFKLLIMPVASLYVDIEREGVFVDTARMDEVEEKLRADVAAAKKIMDTYAPNVNWASPKQVGDLLFNKLKLPVLDKTAKGAPSTSESVLMRLAEMHEIPKQMMLFRGAQQQLSFFIEGWKPWIVNRRLHPSFKIHGTVTGRPSCENPNLQQVPRDPFIRSLLKAPPGWELVDADLSQIELRIAAELAQEKNMLHAFQTGEDVHWKTVLREIHRGGGYKKEVLATAGRLTNHEIDYNEAIELMLKAGPDACVEIDKSWKELRKKAKAINFGYLYGMWWKKFVIYARDNYGVKVTDREAQDSRIAFFDLYPTFEKWHNKQRRFAASQGYIRTLTGRKRRLPAAQYGFNSPEAQEAQRQAINSPVQSFASDLNLMAALQMKKEFDYEWFRIVGTVHDSILMLVRKDKLALVCPRVKEIMRHPDLMDKFGIKLSVPIEAEVAIGPWGASVSDEKYFATLKERGNVVTRRIAGR